MLSRLSGWKPSVGGMGACSGTWTGAGRMAGPAAKAGSLLDEGLPQRLEPAAGPGFLLLLQEMRLSLLLKARVMIVT